MTAKKKRRSAEAEAQQPSSPEMTPEMLDEARRLLEAEQQAIDEADERNPVLPSLRTDPFGAAQIVLDRWFTKDGVRLLICYREDWYHYKQECWRLVSEGDVKSALFKRLLDCRQVDAEGEIHGFVTKPDNVNIVYFQIKENEVVPSDLTPPCVREPDGSWRAVDGRGLAVCSSEIVDMRTGKAQPTLYTFIPNGAEWRYDAAAKDCPVWMQFLQDLFGDKADEVAMLQEFFGYTLAGDTWAQKALIITGPPRAGKGIIGHVLSHLLGESMVASPALHTLGGTFGLESLVGKRLCLISDARLSNRQDIFAVIETLLRIIGGDNVSVNRKNKLALDVKLGVRVLLLSNEMPQLSDNSDAINHRFLILQLEQSFLGSEDVHLLDKLLVELPAIANWAIAGYRRLIETYKFTEPKSSRDARDEWREEDNPLKQFLDDRCEITPLTMYVKMTVLYEAYKAWCEERGIPFMASHALSRRLAAMLGKRIKRTKCTPPNERHSARVINGLELKKEPF